MVPQAAGPALAVGRLAARQGAQAVAETWLRRTIGLARRSRDAASYAGALFSLGQLSERSARLKAARAEYWSAVRHARRHGLYELQGRAVHGLLRIALREQDHSAAAQQARRVLRFYRRGHSKRGAVLLDAAEAELRGGAYASAAAMLREALTLRLDTTREQVRAHTMLIRTAGGLDDRRSVEHAWHRALVLIDAHGSSPEGIRLLLNLARAGAEVMEDAHADVAAQRALAWASRAGDTSLAVECRAFLARTRLPARS
jgi:tetratricopeptide (TPR) repeat protein